MSRHDDLLGPDPDEEEVSSSVETDWGKLRSGVSITWLKGLTGMDHKTVKKRLGPCKAKGKKLGFDVYDPIEALSYLIKPKFDVADYMKTMNIAELPPMLRKEYWEAENKKLTYQERAGELWRTSDVLAVFAEAFKLIKTTTQVWADDVERDAGLKAEQYKALIGRVDALREDLYRTLCEMPKDRNTASVLEDGPLARSGEDEAI